MAPQGHSSTIAIALDFDNSSPAIAPSISTGPEVPSVSIDMATMAAMVTFNELQSPQLHRMRCTTLKARPLCSFAQLFVQFRPARLVRGVLTRSTPRN